MIEIKTNNINSEIKNEKKTENFNSPDKRIDIKPKENFNLSTDENTVFNPDKRIESKFNEITEQDINDYCKDLKRYSEYPGTIPDKPFSAEDIERCSSKETGNKRNNFQGNGENDRNNPEYKENLRNEWEKRNGIPWPRYTKDNCPANRKVGDCYDAHHIKPLSWGGKNEPSNITPMHCDVHYDSRGVHSKESPYTKIDKKLKQGENEND